MEFPRFKGTLNPPPTKGKAKWFAIILAVVAAVALAITAGCGPSLPAVAMPSPVMVGTESPVVCLEQATKVFQSDSVPGAADKAATFCLQTRDREADRAETAAVVASEAEQARPSCSWWSPCPSFGTAAGTIPPTVGLTPLEECRFPPARRSSAPEVADRTLYPASLLLLGVARKATLPSELNPNSGNISCALADPRGLRGALLFFYCLFYNLC